MDIGQYLYIGGWKNRYQESFTALYNHKTKEIFELLRTTTCDTSRYFNLAGMENDLYGVGTISLSHYSKKIDRFVAWGRVEGLADYYDFNCIRNKKVKYPELRDLFLEIAEDPEGSYQKIIVLMKLK